MDHTLRNCYIIHNVQPLHAQFLGTLLLGLVIKGRRERAYLHLSLI